MINQALKMQIHPAFWAFLATQGSSWLWSGLARPPSHWGHPGCVSRRLLLASQAPVRMNKEAGLPVLTIWITLVPRSYTLTTLGDALAPMPLV